MTAAPGRSLAELGRLLGGEVQGDASLVVTAVAPLDTAGPSDLSFVANPSYLQRARESRAGAVLVGPGVDLGGRTALVVADPYLALAVVLEIYHPPTPIRPGVSREAVIGFECRIDEGAEIQARAVIGDRCRIGAGTKIGSGAVLGSGVTVGRDATVHPNATLYDGCVLGDRVIVHSGAVIGSDGFGYAMENGRRRKIPQVGIVSVEDDVEIGANTTIDRATFGATVIGRGTKIDNLVQVAHNVVLGEDCVLVAQVGLSGSVKVGRRVVFAGQSGAVGHIAIGDDVTVGAKSAVTQDAPAGSFLIGHPAIEAGAWKRAAVLFARLPELRRRLMRLEGRRDEEGPGTRSEED